MGNVSVCPQLTLTDAPRHSPFAGLHFLCGGIQSCVFSIWQCIISLHRNLACRDCLREEELKYATLRFRSQELGAPARLLEPPEESKQQPTRPPIVSRKTTIPLLNLPQHNSSQLGE
jgi:hypothetical protein